MGRDVDSLVTALRHVQTDVMFSLDSAIPPIPFDEQVSPRKYVMTDPGLNMTGSGSIGPMHQNCISHLMCLFRHYNR